MITVQGIADRLWLGVISFFTGLSIMLGVKFKVDRNPYQIVDIALKKKN